MNALPFLIFSLLFYQGLAVEMDAEPRKNNMVSNYLNKILDKIFEEVSRTNLSIPEVDLGEDVGRFSDIEAVVLGGLTKKMDGIGSWGFKLDANATGIVIGGQYDLVHLDVPMLFPFFGKGPFLLSFEAVNLALELKAKTNFTTERFDIDIPKLEIVVRNSKVQFNNLMNDPFLSDFLNELISNLIPDLVTMLTPLVLEQSKPVVNEIGNGIIYCIKTELITGKVDECIRDLFQKTAPVASATISKGLTANLIANYENLPPPSIS